MSDYYCLQIEFGTPLYDWCVHLRNVELRIPLGLEFTTQDLSEEYKSLHFGCFLPSGELVACCMVTPLSLTEAKVRQVATFTEYQKQGFGKKLSLFVENYLFNQGCEKITLHAREVAIPFYQKLNYQEIGDKFIEVGITHQAMVKYLKPVV